DMILLMLVAGSLGPRPELVADETARRESAAPAAGGDPRDRRDPTLELACRVLPAEQQSRSLGLRARRQSSSRLADRLRRDPAHGVRPDHDRGRGRRVFYDPRT